MELVRWDDLGIFFFAGVVSCGNRFYARTDAVVESPRPENQGTQELSKCGGGDFVNVAQP